MRKKYMIKCLFRRLFIAFVFISALVFVRIDEINRYFMTETFMHFNLTQLEEYPEVRIEYCRPKMLGLFLEVGVSPFVTPETEERIREIGYYPYDSLRVRYVDADEGYDMGMTPSFWPPLVGIK